jgi:nucleoside-diphosphate kinase
MLAEEHYAEHRDKVFFPSLIDFIMGRIHYPDEPDGRRVIALVYQGPDATNKLRDIAGPTNPHVARDKKPGCIRSLGTVAPLKDSEGNLIGERMDNLIHASATDSEAEREIKLWFTPNDMSPFMRAYTTDASEDCYYLKKNRLYITQEPGSICFLTPGAIAWKSDLEALKLLHQGKPAPSTIEAVVAKYLINRIYADD